MRLSYKKVRFVSNLMLVGTLTILVSTTIHESAKNSTISISLKEAKYTTPYVNKALMPIDYVTPAPTKTPCVLERGKDVVDTSKYIYVAPVYDIPLDAGLQKYTFDTCVEYGIEQHYELILAMMWQESNFSTDVVSSTNDYGIMQINSCNHKALKEKLNFVDIMEPENNIESGIYLISNLLKKYDNRHKALMAYNMGEGGAKRLWRRGIYSSSYSRGIVDKANKILDKVSE